MMTRARRVESWTVPSAHTCVHAPGRPSALLGIVGVPNGDAEALIEACARNGITIAAAESLTGGLLTAALTEIPGASSVVRGGIVCYATDVKASAVGVDPALLDREGPVHPEVAAQLAEGVRHRLATTVGIGLTGVAGPEPQGGQPAGTVFIGLATPAVTKVYRLADAAPAGSRQQVRAAAVRSALALLATVSTDDW